jgi:hypothetical protein
MPSQTAVRRRAPRGIGILVGALGCAALGSAHAQTLLQGAAGGSVGATDNALALPDDGRAEIEPATYLVGTARLQLRHDARVNAISAGYSLSAYKYVDADEELSDTTTHNANLSGSFEFGPDRTLGLGASFTRGRLNVLVPFSNPLAPTQTGPEANLPQLGATLRRPGPLDYVSFGLNETFLYRFEGRYLLEESFSFSYFHPTSDEAVQPETWTGEVGGRLERAFWSGIAGLASTRLGHTRAGDVMIEGLSLSGRSLWFLDLMAGARVEIGRELSFETALGAYATFNAENPAPGIGPAFRAEGRWRPGVSSVGLRYDHTVSASAFTGDTFESDAVSLEASTALGRFETLRLTASASASRGHRLRAGSGRIPGAVTLLSASGGVEWDPDGPFSFSLTGTTVNQRDTSGTSDTIPARRLNQNLVLFTAEASYPYVDSEPRRDRERQGLDEEQEEERDRTDRR